MKKIKLWWKSFKQMVYFPSREARINQRLDRSESLIDVGVDLHMYGDSWAVICIAGKSEYVSFHALGRNGNNHDLIAIRHMLNDMRKSNVTIDAYPGFANYLRRDVWG